MFFLLYLSLTQACCLAYTSICITRPMCSYVIFAILAAFQFGYDPNQNPPNYGIPDGEVVNNTKEVQDNRDFWEVRSKQLVALMEKRDREEE